MKEEEAVFGPLLKENFERKELEDMNETVLKQHTLFREKVRSEKSLVKAVKRKRSGDVFDELDFTLDDLRFRKSYCQEVNDHLVIIIILYITQTHTLFLLKHTIANLSWFLFFVDVDIK
jgi:hypothetical protein